VRASIWTYRSRNLPTLVSLPATVAAAQKAFGKAGILPADVDVAEVHDCFSIAEWVALEDVGLVARGGAPHATSSGETSLQGRIPVNPSGGLLAKGHPVGATGVAQIVEIVHQLRGTAANQIPAAAIGMAQNVGGTGGLASVTILARAA
jgi:acetyl-CoA C-acetyltransferase